MRSRPFASRRNAEAHAVVVGAFLMLMVLVAPAAAQPQWENVASAAGIAYREGGELHPVPAPHEPPNLDWPGFPEIMGGGACWADLDNDGYEDLYLVNQIYNAPNPAYTAWHAAADTRNRLYLNNGDGTFRDATDGSGADAAAWGYGCSAADYDGDGCRDLVATNFGPTYLFRGHCDGTFTNATAALGAVGQDGACGDYVCMSTSSAWGDYDRDGFIDLYMDNYVETFATDFKRGPNQHVSQYNFLLHNNGDGTFAEVAQQVGAAGYHEKPNGSKSLGVAWFDYDGDGWPDIYVANDESPNNLFHNNGDGTFSEVANASGVDDRRAGMGLTAGDYDNDGWPDLFFTHYEHELNGFYRNMHDGTFQDRSGEDDQEHSLNRTGWGTRFVDYDRDGWLDIVLGNGHTEWFLENYDQDFQVFHNEAEATPNGTGDRHWVEVSDASGPGLKDLRVNRGVAFGDAELDGAVDIVAVPNANETAMLLRGSGVTNHWLYLDLREPGANRDALGAQVTLTAGGLTQVREHYPGQAYLSQNSMLMDFGLGSNTQADAVVVRWTDGTTTVLQDVPADRVVRIVEGTAGYLTDTLAPRTTIALSGTGQQGWWRSAVVATVTAQDLAVGPASGVVLTEVSVDGGPWGTFDGAPITFATEGVHTVRARSLDAVGNQEPTRTVQIPIDLTSPTPVHSVAGTQGLSGWYVTEATVTLSALDDRSGPGAIRVRVDGGAWEPYTEAFVLQEGAHALDVVVADVAGNEAADSFVVDVDTTVPDLASAKPAPGGVYLMGARVLQLPDGPAFVVPQDGQRFVVEAAASDATSGVAFVRFAMDGELLGADADAPYTASWDATNAPRGVHVLTITATDTAGNARQVEVRIVLLPMPHATLEGPLLAGLPPLASVALTRARRARP